MNKKELIDLLSDKSGEGKNTVTAVLDAFVEIIQDSVLNTGDTVAYPGLGTFKQKQSAARAGRNPLTGESIQIAAKTKVTFTPGKELKR